MIQPIPCLKILLSCIVLLAATLPQASAQKTTTGNSSEVAPRGSCDGRFDRMLQGFTINPHELDAFLKSGSDIVYCRAALNYSKPADMAIDAWMAMHDNSAAARARAFERFTEACKRDVSAACYYAALFDSRTQDLATDETQLRRALEPLASSGPPAAAVKLAKLLRKRDGDNEATRERIDKLLSSAQARGDGEAAYERASMATFLNDPIRRTVARERLLEAVELGNVPATMTMAALMTSENPEIAREYFVRVANSDQRFFKLQRANASYVLAEIHRTGVGGLKDSHQAEYWLKRAAELGNEKAWRELRRK